MIGRAEWQGPAGEPQGIQMGTLGPHVAPLLGRQFFVNDATALNVGTVEAGRMKGVALTLLRDGGTAAIGLTACLNPADAREMARRLIFHARILEGEAATQARAALHKAAGK